MRQGSTTPRIVIVLVALLAAGCQDGPKHDVASGMSPAAARLLVGGQEALQQGAYDTALAMADSAQGLEPDLADAPFLRGTVLAELGRLEHAAAAFERTLALDPAYRGAHLNLGHLAFRQGELREALSLYQQEKDRYPATATLVYIGRVHAALGETERARLAYEQAIRRDGTHAPAYAYLSHLMRNTGRAEEALSYAQEALLLAPGNLDYRYLAGALLLQNGHPEEAAAHLESVIGQRPWHYGAHHSMGQVQARLGAQEKAQRYLQHADTLQQLQAQIEQMQGTAEVNPDVMRNWILLAQALRATGRLGEAERAYNRALHLDPSSLVVQNSLAGLALERGDPKEALRRYRALLQQDSTFVDGWFNLGVVFARSGQQEKAAQAWRHVLELDGEHAPARQYLSRLTQ